MYETRDLKSNDFSYNVDTNSTRRRVGYIYHPELMYFSN